MAATFSIVNSKAPLQVLLKCRSISSQAKANMPYVQECLNSKEDFAFVRETNRSVAQDTSSKLGGLYGSMNAQSQRFATSSSSLEYSQHLAKDKNNCKLSNVALEAIRVFQKQTVNIYGQTDV
ncbi:hypothetical protein K7432_005908 [Basidiobolus ranarum]|uniref:Uncharacterized protein n=1 Tax=Basidiobolus ranarum TaxID=34480 RepID=A0ABR2WVW9_9FUNG